MLLGIPTWIHYMLLWTNSGGFHYQDRSNLVKCFEEKKILGDPWKYHSYISLRCPVFTRFLMACSFFMHIHWFDVNHTSASTPFHLLYHSPCSELRLNHVWENIRLSHFVCNRPNRHHSTSVPRAEADHTLPSRILKEKHHSQSVQGENSNHLFVAKRKLALTSPVGIAYVFVTLHVYEELRKH